jgi:hypothetical protein
MIAFRKFLGIVILLVWVFLTYTFVYLISISNFSNNRSLTLVMIGAAICLFLLLQYLFLTRFGFYEEVEPGTRWKLMVLPSVALIALLTMIWIEYQHDIARIMPPALAEKNLKKTESKKPDRASIMVDSNLTIREKLIRLQLGERSESVAFEALYSFNYVTRDGAKPAESRYTGYELANDFRSRLTQQFIRRSNDSVYLTVSNGTVSSLIEYPNQKILGFWKLREIFIRETKFYGGSRYACINAKTGRQFDGIPMYSNSDDFTLLADARFVKNSSSIDLDIRYWFLDGDEYAPVGVETVPMTFFFRNIKTVRPEITGLRWEMNDFVFNLEVYEKFVKQVVEVRVKLTPLF